MKLSLDSRTPHRTVIGILIAFEFSLIGLVPPGSFTSLSADLSNSSDLYFPFSLPDDASLHDIIQSATFNKHNVPVGWVLLPLYREESEVQRR